MEVSERARQKEIDVMSLRYLDKWTLEQVARRYGVTRGRISQLQVRGRSMLDPSGKLRKNIHVLQAIGACNG